MARLETRAIARFHNSIELGSTQRGHKNRKIYTQIHRFIDYLVSIEQLPPSAVVGRLKVGNFTRTACAIDFGWLDAHRAEILDALEDRFGVDPDEAYQVLEQGAVIAAYHQLIAIKSVAIDRFISLFNSVPESVQSMMVGSPNVRQDILSKMAA